jgi:crossover junction endodeoxyribonuclease RusA
LLNGVPKFAGRLRVQILVRPPDQRARDLDNVLKCLLDSLTRAGVWDDDSQVDSLLVVRGDQVDGGSVLVLVEDL